MPGRNPTKLTEREERFCLEYVRHNCRAIDAARAAGYVGDDHTLRTRGWENLQKPRVREYLRNLREGITMEAIEVLQRLADQARASLDDFVNPDTDEIDLARARERAVLHLAQEVSENVQEFTTRDGDVTRRIRRTVKLYSAQEALRILAKHHALLTDVLAVRDLPKDERELDALIEHHLKRVMGPERAEIVLKSLREPLVVH